MEDELWMRCEEDPTARARHRAKLHIQVVESVGRTIQADNPEVLSDDVVAHLVLLAYLSTFPMLCPGVDETVARMTHPVVRRAYEYTRRAIHLYVAGWHTKKDLATENDWEAWLRK